MRNTVGPKELHDAYRVDKRGKGSFDRVTKGFEFLRSRDVDVNVLCTVHTADQDHPLDVCRFFRDEMGVRFIQAIPIVERTTETLLPLANLGWSTNRKEKRPLYNQAGDQGTNRTVNPKKFGQFLTSIFDEWLAHDVVFCFTFSATHCPSENEGHVATSHLFRGDTRRAPGEGRGGEQRACEPLGHLHLTFLHSKRTRWT